MGFFLRRTAPYSPICKEKIRFGDLILDEVPGMKRRSVAPGWIFGHLRKVLHRAILVAALQQSMEPSLRVGSCGRYR